MSELPILVVSFSGGRTSAFMAQWLKKNMSHKYRLIFIFANTGWEHPDTLRFAHAVDTYFGLELVWVESVPRRDEKKSSGHRVVTYETASRNGEPFEAVASAYGLPNQTYGHCTRELKLNPINDYLASIGCKGAATAIGIRSDELRRVSKRAEVTNIVYPLVDWVPTDKQDVLAFFEDFDWDLNIPEHQGNCIGCFKKSERKLLTLYREDPGNFYFAIKIDQLYRNVGPNNVPGPRKMYRGFRSAPELVEQFAATEAAYQAPTTDGGCSESCELFPTETS